MPPRALAQITGTPTPVAVFAPVDAVALGVTRAASIGVFAADYQVVIGAGAGLAGGALRGFVGAASDMWSAGLGYAHTIGVHQLTNTARTSAGLQLVAGYRHDTYFPHSFGAARLTAPVGVTIGDPNERSSDSRTFAIYAAPYADAGVTDQLDNSACIGSTLCTAYRGGSAHSAGIGAGSRLSFGQFAIELMARDLVGANFQKLYIGYVALGASLRL